MNNVQASTFRSAELQTAKEMYTAWQKEKKDFPIAPAPHSLGLRLIVSLTSYRPRLQTLHLTIRSLIEQTVQPDSIIIWLTSEDRTFLPSKPEYHHDLVRVETCDELGPYKKLVPALLRYPEAAIVTVDDDAYYHRHWLSQLLNEYDGDGSILCHIAYRVHFTSEDNVAPYGEWTRDVQDRFARQPSTDLIPIGVGGVLYPPKSLSPLVTNRLLFTRVCPGCDDLWFYAMARLNGTRARKIGTRLYQVLWPGTQDSALWIKNVAFNNDCCIGKLTSRFGATLFASAI